LEQLSAASEVLKVISSSPGELEPVFQAMLENAVQICDAKFGTLYRCENETFEAAAHFGAPTAYVKFQRQRGLFQPPAGTALDCILQKKELVSIADVAAAGGRLGRTGRGRGGKVRRGAVAYRCANA
jgi:GAF domain-containing protein